MNGFDQVYYGSFNDLSWQRFVVERKKLGNPFARCDAYTVINLSLTVSAVATL